MSRLVSFCVALVGVALLPLAGRADSISLVSPVSGVNGGWITYTGGTSGLNTAASGYGTPYSASSPFWNNGSFDGAGGKNVGNYLTKSNYFATNQNSNSPGIPVNNLQFWGSTSNPGQADPYEIFTTNGAVNATFQIGLAGNYSGNQLWVAEVNGSGVPIASTAQELFNGTQTAGQTATFTVTGDFIFYMQNTTASGGPYLFASDTTLAGSSYNNDSSNQHFAVFQNSSSPGTLYVGVEDLPFGADQDYNDLVFSIQPVPEPSTFVLLALGGLGCVVCRYRRHKRPVANSL